MTVLTENDVRVLAAVFEAACIEQTTTMAYSWAVAADYTDDLIAKLDHHQLRALHRVATRLDSATRWAQATNAATQASEDVRAAAG